MNKDRAKHIESLKKIKDRLEQEQNKLPNNILRQAVYQHEIEREIQAIDYAIEQMENDNLLERLENGECYKHLSNKVVAYNREWLEDNLEMEFDLLKFARDITSKMSDDEIAERLSKVVEPYVRSDENE